MYKYLGIFKAPMAQVNLLQEGFVRWCNGEYEVKFRTYEDMEYHANLTGHNLSGYRPLNY